LIVLGFEGAAAGGAVVEVDNLRTQGGRGEAEEEDGQ
jgi:hypothetical protein